MRLLDVHAPNIPPLLRHKIDRALDRRHQIIDNLLPIHTHPPHLHPNPSPIPKEQERGPANPPNRLRPPGPGQIDPDRDLLLLKEVIADQPREQREDAAIREEEVVGIAEFPAGFEWDVVRAEVGQGDDGIEGEVGGGRGGFGGFGEGVCGEEAEGGAGRVEGVEGVGEGNYVGIGAGGGGEAEEAEVEVEEILMFEKLGFLVAGF